MPIFIWICAVAGVIGFIGCIVWIVWAITRRDPSYGEFSNRVHVAAAIATMLACVCLTGGTLFWLYGTASGQRAQKSFSSETGGGLTRVVKVYDLQGDVIATYEGKFDIQADSTRVFFDRPQKDGSTKRVQVYNGLVIVEEQ